MNESSLKVLEGFVSKVFDFLMMIIYNKKSTTGWIIEL